MSTQTITLATVPTTSRMTLVRRRWRSRLGTAGPPRTPRELSRDLQHARQRHVYNRRLA